MARQRPGDDAAGERPGDDEVLDNDVVADDDAGDETVGDGGTALRERTDDADSPKKERKAGGGGFLGRIGRFFREVVSELRKVIWPTRRELLTYSAVVIAFVTVVTAIVAGLDYAFAKGVLFSFGN